MEQLSAAQMTAKRESESRRAIAEADEQLAETRQAMTEANKMTKDEKEAAEKAELFATHKVRGTLGVYYRMYPDDRPKSRFSGNERESGGRER